MKKTTLCSTKSLKSRIAESRGRLYRVALAWCGDEMLADDLAQETIATGIRNYKQLRDENSMFSWVCSIMRNHWYHQLRKQKNHDEIDTQIPCNMDGPLGNCQQKDTIKQVRQAVARLTLEQRQIISLVDLGELPYCQVAEALDIPVGTVMSRLHRARKKLLKIMEEYQQQPAKPVIHIHMAKK